MGLRRNLRRVDRLIALAVVAALVPVTALLTGTAQALAPTPVLSPYVTYPVGTAHGVAIGDFTGDGHDDAVVSTERADGDHVDLFARVGDGGFARIQSLDTTLDYMPEAGMAAGDLDGDGHVDAALATGHSVEVFFQRAGLLAPAQTVAVPGAQELAVADLDGDGRSDMVVVTWIDRVVALLLLRGVGDGQFAPAVSLGDGEQFDVQVGDVTGDDRLDVVTCAKAAIRVYEGVGDATFRAPVEYVTGSTATDYDRWCHGVTLGDLDGDGRLDVAFPAGLEGTVSRVYLLAQKVDGTLAPAVSYRTGAGPDGVVAGDMNGDDRTDLVVIHGGIARVGIHAQAPDHSLDPEREYPIPPTNLGLPKRTALGDVNGDGRVDIVMGHDREGLVVLWGQAPGPSTTTSTSILTPPPVLPIPWTSLLAPAQNHDILSHSSSLATGDFNGDGRNDLAMVTGGNFDAKTRDKVFLLLQGPNGALSRTVKFDTDNSASDAMVLAAGDLDGDGFTDLVLRMRFGIDIYLQRDGTFADRKFVELPVASRVDVADLDGDGVAELIMTGYSGIFVHRSLGGTALSPPVRISDVYTTSLAVGDVTGDGRPDLVANGGVLQVYRQLADGTFAGATRYPIAGRYPSTVTIGDLSGDGRADVVVATGWGSSLDTSEIHILNQTASGTLGVPTSYANPKPETMRVADIDGDRRNDIVVSHDGSVGLLLQQTDGRFTPERSSVLRYSAAHLDTALVVADVTGDGKPDVAVADHNNGMAFLRNVAPPFDPALRYINRLTGDLLGRPATPSEVAAWRPMVATANDRFGLAVAMVSGPEYRSRRVAEEARYRLGHAPDPGQSAALVAAIARGGVIEVAAALFLGSDEFYARSGSTPEVFVDALFVDVFGVSADPAGRAALAGVIRNGYSRTALAVLVLLHPAARGRLVDVAYERYLGFRPSPAMRAWWVDFIVGGFRSEYLVAYLVSIDEYYYLG
jgi:hypothetical protein